MSDRNVLPGWRFAVAPMMDWTDRHCRAFHRLLTRRARLYTEMVTADAVVFGPRERLIGFDAAEHPVALQLGGAGPARLAEAARIGADFGYDEINLNCGCPSDRVQDGRFGACLMREPALVADCMAAMGAAVAIPVTVKCRLGVDDQAPEDSLFDLVDRCAAAGVRQFIVHARKAWLKGLSPKENRDVPPLDYPLVWRLKAERPALTIVINGGIGSLDEAEAHLARVDGVMLGRAAYHEPGILGEVDRRIFGAAGPDVGPFEAIERYRPYLERNLARGVSLAAMTHPMIGLFHGWPGARAWRRILTTLAVKPGAGIAVVDEALGAIAQAAERRERSYSAAMI
jgi:tRNA-dihydrouridine synthase A